MGHGILIGTSVGSPMELRGLLAELRRRRHASGARTWVRGRC